MRSRFPRPGVQSTGTAALSLTIFLLTAATSVGQDTSADSWPLGRYVPKDNVILYVEYDGLDAHADAWKKTAAYKILNDTPTGAMLEDLAIQLLDRMFALDRTGKPVPKAADVIALCKHVARSGFLFARVANPKGPGKSLDILVLRNAFKDKNIRTIVARNLLENAPNTKPQPVVRAGHRIVSGVDVRGKSFAWWVEETKKEDVVIVFQKAEEVDMILETLDGQHPSMIDHPRRAELVKPEKGFVPNGLVFVEPLVFRGPQIPEALGLGNLTKIDLRWGFQDDALMSVTRIATSGERKGVLAFLDGSTFDKDKLPPIPESVGDFTVISFDLKTTVDKFVSLAKASDAAFEKQWNQFLDSVKATTKLRLKEDILAHLGPKVAWYIIPGKTPVASPAGPNILSRMTGGVGIEIPRVAIVFDIDDPVAVGKMLDEAMIAANRELKALAAKNAPEPTKGARNRSNPPTLEFRLKEDPKTYFLSVPSELSSQYPASFRPAIQVGPKHLVLAVSLDAAKAVLESKAMWSPPKTMVGPFKVLSPKLKVLSVSDPRETLPPLLATLPAKIQSVINTVILMQSKGTPPPAGSTIGPGPGAPGGMDESRRRAMAGGPTEPGRPGAPGAPGADPASNPPPTLVLQVDPAKLPSADKIKELLFPSIFTVEVDGEEVKVTSRQAVPSVATPSGASTTAVAAGLLLPAVQAAREAARRARMGGGGPLPGGAPPITPPPPGVAPPGTPSPPEGGGPQNRRGPMSRPGGSRPTVGGPTP